MKNRSLAAKGLTKYFGERCVLDDFDIEVRSGEIVGLLGPSGSGKSTIFNILTGIIAADQGRVFLGDLDVTNLNIEVRSGLGVGYVSQSSDLFESLTAEQNLEVAFSAKLRRGEQFDELMDIVLRFFGLTALRHQVVGKLSGGQRKMVKIAFAICTKPSILLLDEPFAGVDPISVARLSEYLRRLARIGVGIVLTDHKVHDAMQVVERAYVINNGILIQSGSPRMVSKDPLVRHVFLGENFSF